MERKLKDVREGERLFFEIVDFEGNVVEKRGINLPKRKIGKFYDWLLTRINLNEFFVRIVDAEGNNIVDLGGEYG